MTMRHRLFAPTLLALTAAPALAAAAPAPTLAGFVLALLVLCAPVGATWAVWRRARAGGRSRRTAAARGAAAGASAFFAFLLLHGLERAPEAPPAGASRIAGQRALPESAAHPQSSGVAVAVPVPPTRVAATGEADRPATTVEERAWYTLAEMPWFEGGKLVPRAVCQADAGGPASAIESLIRTGVAHRIDETQTGQEVVEVRLTTLQGSLHFVRGAARCAAVVRHATRRSRAPAATR
jgi:hypothetical protein